MHCMRKGPDIMIITIKDSITLYPIYSGFVSLEYLKVLQQDKGFIIEVNNKPEY